MPDLLGAGRELSPKEEGSISVAGRVSPRHAQTPGEGVRGNPRGIPRAPHPKAIGIQRSLEPKACRESSPPMSAHVARWRLLVYVPQACRARKDWAPAAPRGVHQATGQTRSSCSPRSHRSAAVPSLAASVETATLKPPHGLSNTVFCNQSHHKRRAWFSRRRLRTPRPP